MADNIIIGMVPDNLRLPGANVAVDHTHATILNPSIPRKSLLVGQRLSSGTVPANVLHAVNSADDAAKAFGYGSMLHRMAMRYLAKSPYSAVYAIALDDDPDGIEATGTITYAGPSTQAGVIYLYIAGQRLTVGVAKADTATAIATKVTTAINAKPSLPVSASSSGATITLTCQWKGTTGNDIDIRHNYYTGESLPDGITATITDMVDGEADPDPTDMLVAIAGSWFYTWIFPYTDPAMMAIVDPDLEDRWSATNTRSAHAFRAISGSYSTISTYGESRNSKHFSTLPLRRCPTPPWEVAAAWGAGVDRKAASTDPIFPFTGISIDGMLAPAPEDRWSPPEANNLAYSGMSSWTIDDDGTCRVGLVLTEYQTNTQGVEDISLLHLNHKWGADLVRYTFRVWMNGLLASDPGFKLAAENPKNVPYVLDPTQLALLSYPVFGALEDRGLVQDFAAYKHQVRFAISGSNPTRVNAIIPPKLLSPLLQFAAAVQFQL